MSVPVLTLLTDFGGLDSYVGAMKGVFSSLCEARIVDLTHEVAPFDVAGASYLLESAAFHFPPRSVHVAVVDPGVGSSRRVLAAECGGQRFLAPDNGLLSFLSRRGARFHTVLYSEEGLSPTFHGRDLFMPLAARLFHGAEVGDLGPAAEPPRPPLEFERTPRGVATHVLLVDRFGTLICALRGENVPPGRVFIHGQEIGPLRRTFADVAPGTPLAYIGSSGRLEVAVNLGRADERLHAGRGTVVEILP